MSDDLIRRQDAIGLIESFYKIDKSVLDIMVFKLKQIAALEAQTPSSQPEPQWIPCSERLPELDQEVLVYAIGKDDGFIGDAVTTISERFIFRLFPSSDGVEEWRSPWQYFSSNYEITHWMPLPDPPKGGIGMSEIAREMTREELVAVNNELRAENDELKEKLEEARLAVEHNRHVAEENQLKYELHYRDGVIYGMKYALRCNGVSGAEVIDERTAD